LIIALAWTAAVIFFFGGITSPKDLTKPIGRLLKFDDDLSVCPPPESFTHEYYVRYDNNGKL